MKRAILYARVSTADKGQDWRAQLEELRTVAKQRGWKVVGEYHDMTSGRKASRPGLDAARAHLRRGGVNVFAAVSTDRFARSVPNLLDLVDELEALGVQVSATREGALDSTTPQGRAFMIVRGAFAELERGLRAEGIREGLAIRRARGIKLGRPRRLDYRKLQLAQRMRKGLTPATWSTIAQRLGGTPGAWSRAVDRATKAGSERRRPAHKTTGALRSRAA